MSPARPHTWRNYSPNPSVVLLRCDTCGARTNNAFLADIHDCQPHEATPTESMVALPGLTVRADDITSTTELAASIYLVQNEGRPESEWDPLPEGLCAEDIQAAHRRVEARRANTRKACEYIHDACLPVPQQCRVDGCHNMTCNVVCMDCEDGIAAGEFDARPIPWRTVLWFCAAIVAVVAALYWGAK